MNLGPVVAELAMAENGTKCPNRAPGRARPLCLTTSDVDFLGDLESVIDLNTEITHRALDLGMAEQKLYRAQVASAAIDQRRLCSTHGMSGKLARVETDAADPLGDQPRILARRQRPIEVPATWEQVVASLAIGVAKVVIEGLPRRLGQLKANGPAGLPLSDSGPVLCVAVGCHISDAEADEVAATQFAVYSEVEQRQVPHALLQSQFGADRPDLTPPQGWFWAGQLAFIPGWSRDAGSGIGFNHW